MARDGHVSQGQEGPSDGRHRSAGAMEEREPTHDLPTSNCSIPATLSRKTDTSRAASRSGPGTRHRSSLSRRMPLRVEEDRPSHLVVLGSLAGLPNPETQKGSFREGLDRPICA